MEFVVRLNTAGKLEVCAVQDGKILLTLSQDLLKAAEQVVRCTHKSVVIDKTGIKGQR